MFPPYRGGEATLLNQRIPAVPYILCIHDCGSSASIICDRLSKCASTKCASTKCACTYYSDCRYWRRSSTQSRSTGWEDSTDCHLYASGPARGTTLWINDRVIFILSHYSRLLILPNLAPLIVIAENIIISFLYLSSHLPLVAPSSPRTFLSSHRRLLAPSSPRTFLSSHLPLLAPSSTVLPLVLPSLVTLHSPTLLSSFPPASPIFFFFSLTLSRASTNFTYLNRRELEAHQADCPMIAALKAEASR